MQQKGNFLLLERDEFRDWLKKQNVTRKITHLQVHHTYLPNYTTRKNQDPFKCLEGMRNSHLSQGWNDIGQNFTILDTGQIAYSLGRGLNVTPAGIAGANTNMLCTEIVGNFDVGGDKMSDEQKNTVIHFYACLAEKFNIPINTDHIVYHAWYTAKNGTRLPDFIPGMSSKTCPGTAFFEDGNTIAAANKNFIPQIKAELARLKKPSTNVKDDEPMTKEERLAFDNLCAQVESLTKSKDVLKQTIMEQGSLILKLQSKLSMDVPAYAQGVVDKLSCMKDKNGNKVIDTTNGKSEAFYQAVTVLDRTGLFDK
ncbi:peptidoglycan recognition family protein [Paenibacillus sp. XY044]|uniref:peptidoglycan recognition protein family protein n=1 Tax=Paenibacillus sp. XY044 TaxID=2026089 RepID=UPI000B987536|nr:peptidoglycan recognition family protein [Paenibacillus sp. XY044]OZB98002.1 N-acetylmuramoyl-L-alanine amidase [Paenibacillus sp. XY044]